MILTITLIEIKTPFHFFALANYARHNMKQLKESKCVKYKNTGFWKSHYTMTLWNNSEEMKEFAHTGAHLESMKKAGKIAAKTASITIDADDLLDWKIAKERLVAEAKFINY